MKLIEIHILQTFPVSCLNRDDLNSPKTAIFGGVNRARVSSQSWKRAIRIKARELLPECYGGVRTKHVSEEIEKAIVAKTNNPISDAIKKRIKAAITIFSNDPSSDASLFLSHCEIDKLADSVLDTNNDIKEVVKKIIKDGTADFGDIALFGRMAANNTEINIEAAAMFSHAISTSKSDNDVDFFTAVDDCSKETETGSAYMGTLEFNSATYYRYVALNLDQLSENMKGVVDSKTFKEIVSSFIKASLLAVPQARKNSMNADTLPFAVIGIVKDKGQPVQLVNAFERPITKNADGSIAENSARKMKEHLSEMKRIWGLEDICEVSIPEKSLAEFIEEIVSHV